MFVEDGPCLLEMLYVFVECGYYRRIYPRKLWKYLISYPVSCKVALKVGAVGPVRDFEVEGIFFNLLSGIP